MKICMVVPYDLTQEGGVKRHGVRLADELRQAGDEVWLIGSSSVAIDEPYRRGLRGLVNIFSNGSNNCIGIWTCPWQVYCYLRQHKFDVIHSQEPLTPTLPYWMTWFSPRTPHICTFHGFNENENGRSKRARRFWSALTFPFYHRGIAVSQPAARFAAVTWKKPLTIIPNGVPTQSYTPDPAKVVDPQKPLRLLFVGHWQNPRKGFSNLFDAYCSLRESGVPVTLDVVGNGNGEPPPVVPGLTFHGAISDEAVLAQHYRKADVFVATSTGQESFGIVLLEAMSSGCPVICSDIEGYRQVIASEGARLFAPGDSAALAKEIAVLAKHRELCRPMADANRQRAKEFDWAIVAQKVRREYEAVIEERRPQKKR